MTVISMDKILAHQHFQGNPWLIKNSKLLKKYFLNKTGHKPFFGPKKKHAQKRQC